MFNVDISEYIVYMTILDYLILSIDRHYNNFGALIINGRFEFCPLFDFGLGLFEHDKKYTNVSLTEALKSTDFKPLGRKPDVVIKFLVSEGFGSYIHTLTENLHIPLKELFPNELGYEWFTHAYDVIMNVR